MRQVVADKRLKTMKHHFKLWGPKSARGHGRLQEVVVYQRFQLLDIDLGLTGKVWLFWIGGRLIMGGGHLWEGVAHGGSTVL